MTAQATESVISLFPNSGKLYKRILASTAYSKTNIYKAEAGREVHFMGLQFNVDGTVDLNIHYERFVTEVYGTLPDAFKKKIIKLWKEDNESDGHLEIAETLPVLEAFFKSNDRRSASSKKYIDSILSSHLAYMVVMIEMVAQGELRKVGELIESAFGDSHRMINVMRTLELMREMKITGPARIALKKALIDEKLKITKGAIGATRAPAEEVLETVDESDPW